MSEFLLCVAAFALNCAAMFKALEWRCGVKVWFWIEPKPLPSNIWRGGWAQGVSEPGHFWFWFWRINCGVILWNVKGGAL